MRSLAAALLVLCAVLVGAAPASAHNYLVDSTPADGSTLDVLPEVFSVTTNEPLLDLSGDGAGFALEVTDAAGAYFGDGCVTVDGATASTAPELGEPGEYRMLWQVVSADGHTVSGELHFTWAGEATSEGSATPPGCGGGSGPAPAATSTPVPRGDAALGDVLWIGGAVVVVLGAGLVTLLMVTRRKPSAD